MPCAIPHRVDGSPSPPKPARPPWTSPWPTSARGIAAEHLPHLFERFYRADPARDRAHGRSGIGLAIVRAVARAHGGRVSAHSSGPGHGATFVISLPTADTGHLPSGRRHPAGTRRPNEHVRTGDNAPQSTEDPVQRAIERLVAHRSALHTTASRVADPQVRADLHASVHEVDTIVRDIQEVISGTHPEGATRRPTRRRAGTTAVPDNANTLAARPSGTPAARHPARGDGYR